MAGDEVEGLMTLTVHDLEQRKPVWMVFSEFWLDMELDSTDLHRIASILADPPFSLDELESIYLFEVAPVVYLNTFVVAGVWAGFDGDWLSRKRRNELSAEGGCCHCW